MSTPEHEPDVVAAAFEQVAAWLDDFVDVLDDGMQEIRRLVTAVVEDWPDARGREWCSQAEFIQREFGRQMDLGLELSRAAGRTAAEISASAAAEPTETQPGQAPDGIRLGGTEGSRVGGWSGMRIATLPDPDVPVR